MPRRSHLDPHEAPFQSAIAPVERCGAPARGGGRRRATSARARARACRRAACTPRCRLRARSGPRGSDSGRAAGRDLRRVAPATSSRSALVSESRTVTTARLELISVRTCARPRPVRERSSRPMASLTAAPGDGSRTGAAAVGPAPSDPRAPSTCVPGAGAGLRVVRSKRKRRAASAGESTRTAGPPGEGSGGRPSRGPRRPGLDDRSALTRALCDQAVDRCRPGGDAGGGVPERRRAGRVEPAR